MNNPYQSPTDTGDEAAPPEPSQPQTVRFAGGITSVLAVGGGGGIAFMILLVSGVLMIGNYPTMLIIALALIGFASLLVMVSLLRGVTLTMQWKIGLALLLTPIVFVLFVPVCTAGGLATMVTLGAEGYGPTMLGLSLAVMLGFVVAIGCIAATVRAQYALQARRRAGKESVAITEPESASES
ncbi:hypothetical protein Pla52o_32430 [Novipirellula galeiformis]|uniref:Uncharacterized protein n=1 Tax=Novipirellula galeiformis TaxID=2528004 RepID=A0A5C6CD80_9BACT|nr:hypothetical protein [Novipirellula galeiformis]TWU22188.1 hypothetical protein Pla52o_32430 [Novipirellula galeiformis]